MEYTILQNILTELRSFHTDFNSFVSRIDLTSIVNHLDFISYCVEFLLVLAILRSLGIVSRHR